MVKMHAVTAAACLASALMLAPAGASEIADFDPARHNRFVGGNATSGTNVPNPTYLLAGEDLSAVGVNGVGGVLISPRHVLSATHNSGGTSNFGFVNSAGTFVSIAGQSSRVLATLDSTSTNQSTDLRLVYLSREITAADLLTPMAIGVGDDPLFAGLEAYVYDVADRTGRNLIDGGRVYDNANDQEAFVGPIVDFALAGQGTTRGLAYDFDTDDNGGTNGLGGDEMGVSGGDSGQALLSYTEGGDLAVIGIHSAISFDQDVALRDQPYTSFSAQLSAYAGQIDSFVTSDGYAASFVLVPEPTSLALLGAGGLLMLRRRR